MSRMVSSKTTAGCQRVAELLRGDPAMALKVACASAGISWHTVEARMQRARSHGDSPEGLAVIEAHAWQCSELLRRGDEAADSGRSTAWFQWRLERKDRAEYGTRVEVAPSAPDVLAGLSDAQLRRIADGESLEDVTRALTSGDE